MRGSCFEFTKIKVLFKGEVYGIVQVEAALISNVPDQAGPL